MTFDSQNLPLQGVNLIESSAGTGKTYALAELYTRLIVEQQIAVNQILVVTYTRAATQELRDRLRLKLAKMRDECLKQGIAGQTTLKRLELAMQSFDEAAIFTIHGFCQRVLADYAFESGSAFDVEMIGHDDELVRAMADDFWRKYVITADERFIHFLFNEKQTPETLLQSVQHLIGKPYIELLPVPIVETIYQQAQAQFDEVKRLWQVERNEVIAALKSGILNGNQYRASSVDKWLTTLDLLLQAPSLPPLLFADFERFTLQKLQTALKKHQTLPDLDFWAACSLLWQQQQQTILIMDTRALQQLRRDLLTYLQHSLPQHKQTQQLLSYDDLLLNVCKALESGRGRQLIDGLQSQYRAVLIDEFQDTDPIQYDIFRKIFLESSVLAFLVGDPKQAIYSFRGADIFTYLAAKSAITPQYQHTLATNWRSHPGLIAAINHLFKRQQNPFKYADIPFHAVQPGDNKDLLTIDHHDASGLQIVWCGEISTKQAFTDRVADMTADEIARLLTLAVAGKATLYDNKQSRERAITGADIAVLVRSHRQARIISQCLQKRGINSVQHSKDNVFSSEQARILQRVLAAIADPHDETKLSAALATPIGGFSALTLYELQQNEQQWTAMLHDVAKLRQIWLNSGFMRSFRQLLITWQVPQRLLALADGQRQLTNVLHLAELIQENCEQHGGGMTSVLQWLSQQIESANSEDEMAQLRLESDEQLVKIITIHKSKGLEYPIVFCPFLWDAKAQNSKSEVICYHHEGKTKAAFAEPYLSEAAKHAEQEACAEELRLLYVALTRARMRCIIVWGHTKHVEKPALFSLLHPTTLPGDDPDDGLMMTELATLANDHHAITFDVMTDSDEPIKYRSAADQATSLSARQFQGNISAPWRIGSFSTLKRDHDNAELPDYDAPGAGDSLPATTLNRFSFPRGVRAGECLHALFELSDFESQDEDDWQGLIVRMLVRYGFDVKWAKVVQTWLKQVLATPLHGFSLANISHAKRINELAFYFPAHLSCRRLKQQLLPLLADHSPLAITLKRGRFADLSGFMRGFIDLVFEHKGKFYIVDYKSNYLGEDKADYHQAKLNQAMIAHDYPLQYLIYSLALHRYLGLRIADYEPKRHLGGVYYLFIRGMQPTWGQAGVFYDVLDMNMLNALDALVAN